MYSLSEILYVTKEPIISLCYYNCIFHLMQPNFKLNENLHDSSKYNYYTLLLCCILFVRFYETLLRYVSPGVFLTAI